MHTKHDTRMRIKKHHLIITVPAFQCQVASQCCLFVSILQSTSFTKHYTLTTCEVYLYISLSFDEPHYPFVQTLTPIEMSKLIINVSTPLHSPYAITVHVTNTHPWFCRDYLIESAESISRNRHSQYAVLPQKHY